MHTINKINLILIKYKLCKNCQNNKLQVCFLKQVNILATEGYGMFLDSKNSNITYKIPLILSINRLQFLNLICI